MKKFFLIASILLSLLMTSCALDEDEDQIPEAQTNPTNETSRPPEPLNNTHGNEEHSKSQDPEPSESKADGNSEKTQGKSVGINSNPQKVDKTSETNEKTEFQGTDTNQNEPIKQPDSFFDDNQILIMAGVMGVLALAVIWLIYDRYKIKNALNNINNKPPLSVNPPNNPISTAGNSLITGPNENVKIRVGNFQNIGNRMEQQDSFCMSNIRDEIATSNKGFMAVVADGMGGMEDGAAISQIVTSTFLSSYQNQSSIIDPASFLLNAAKDAEISVENHMKRKGVNGGSTVVAVLIKNSQMYYASVGDSHIYLLRNHTLTLLNREHNFAAFLMEKAQRGEVDPQEPYVNPNRHALTAYIGIGNLNVIDRNIQPFFLSAGDKILLCSDGVYNALGDDALIAAMSGDTISIVQKLQQDILSQRIPNQDNFTGIVIECIKI